MGLERFSIFCVWEDQCLGPLKDWYTSADFHGGRPFSATISLWLWGPCSSAGGYLDVFW